MSVGVVDKQTGDRIPTAGMPAIDAALSGSSTNPVQNMVVKAAFDAIKDGQSINSFADVETALGEKADTDIVASDFSAAASYTAGDYCIYEGKFYKFKANHSGAWAAADVDEIKIAGELSSLMSGLTELNSNLNDKVDKVTGKGLSTNDYTNADKTIVDGVTSALSNKVDKVTGKALSTNDYTNVDKSIVANTHRRTRRNITSDLTNLATAVAEQDLEKYGYSIGDYFNGASGYSYHLADMDTYYGGYNNNAVVSTHHITLVVKTGASTPWNSAGNDTSVGYKGSTLHTYLSTTALDNIKTDLKALFGGSTGLEHLIAHKILWTTATSAWDWSPDAEYISALTEPQVYGTNVWAIDGYQTGEAWKWLEIFRKYRYNEILGNIWWWLRSISSASHACAADGRGFADHGGASTGGGAVALIIFH